MRSTLLKVVAFGLLAMCLPYGILAQQGTGVLQGTITDPTGSVLPDAAITVQNQETGIMRSVKTDSQGHFLVPALQTGVYKIRAEHNGFQVEERDNIQLTVGQQLALNFIMKVGTANQTVEVEEQAPLLSTEQSQVSSTISQEQIKDLPLLSRNFLALAALVPGAGRNTSATGTQPLQIGGADSRYNYTTIIDGGDIDDDIWGAPVQNFNEDSIKEFQVVTNRFDAENGGALEALLNVVSKSGTNKYHGTAYGFFRNDAFKARNYFETTKPSFDEQRIGGTLGGPIIKDRTQFFLGYEYVNENRPLTVGIPSSSPLSQYNGSFAAGDTSHLVTGRIDHQLNGSNTLMVRALYEHASSLGGFGGSFAQSFGVNTDRTSYSVLAQDTTVISPRIVNDLRYQFRVTDVNANPTSNDPTEIRPSGTLGAAYYYSQEARHRNQFYDTMYFSRPKNNIKIGGDLTFMQTQYCACAEQSGLFVFATDAPFNASDPSTYPVYFEQSINPSAAPIPDKYFGMFIQDDWRVTKKLTLNLGIRWDVDTRVRDNNTMERAFALPRNASLRGVLDEHPGVNLGMVDPRFGFAYSPFAKTVIRGGVGVYHARARMFMQELALQQLTGDNFFAVITDPTQLAKYPDINGILGGTPSPSGPRAMSNVISNNFQLPYAYNATFGFSQEFGENTVLTADGVYSHSLHDFERRILNLPSSFSSTNPAGTAANPYLYGFGQIQAQVTDGMTWYSGLQVGLTRRLSHHLQGQVSYTYSHSIQLGADTHYSTPSQAIGGLDRGPTLNDMRHKLSIAGVATLPWGFQLSTIVVGNTAPPYNIIAGYDIYGDGTTCCARPVGLGLNQGGNASQNNLDAINSFRQSIGMTSITAQQLNTKYGYFDVDARLTKVFKIGEGKQIELMAEMFNVFNQTNFDAPNGVIISSTFLQPSSSEQSREGQFGIRFRF
jgi:hypothetical protein